MPTKITFVIDNSTNPAAFEENYETIISLARRLPDLDRMESAEIWPKEDGADTPAYRTLDLYFADYTTASAAVLNPTAGELFNVLVGAATPFRALFSDIEQD